MPDIAIVPAPRELVVDDARWVTADPVADAVRTVVENLGETEYRIDVQADGARLSGGSEDALRWAETTYRQLLDAAEPAGDGEVAVPAVRIADAPRFGWRGLMLDVARHFMPKEFVLKVVDVVALHRMNVLHLHLTDDQGWRVQIDAFPQLTEIGAWRPETMVGKMEHHQTEFEYDGTRHGGFYTKDDLREIVAYAAERGITVVPEIDLPGHMQAAIAAYPELGNHPDRQLGVRQVWGISEDVLNVNDATVDFVRTVLREVLEIFPGPYIHLGGDECPAVQWRESEAAQQRQAELGLTEAGQLQGWFTAQVASVLAEQNRRLVGWDEMVETDCPKDAVIMAWRGPDRGEVAAKAGHDVVMAPNQSVYFDYYQGDPATEPLAIGHFTPLEKVYDFEVLPPGLTAEEQARIVGTQCQVWTEYMEDPEQVGYMLLPRLCAFAERAWGSPKTPYDEFLTRLRPHLTRIEALGLNYRPLDR
ncbi:Beta-N-acetylhexosaminidase [Kribbella flavida DSM 17836]|uniref:beta-N-acetylhexosaminidase n=1 Tax=Kribbella flavida (strain DSM 17836 / JCM 10339 / NBRC 14399) TaxID=479435 RepID=D2PX30_KRIFD|nr:beta-N-acetylhexosaminidase [Kribbella flavida]ADB35410.1 Beta-N-acetylhexosaminidase [Kribbella flavida DSM 17836]